MFVRVFDTEMLIEAQRKTDSYYKNRTLTKDDKGITIGGLSQIFGNLDVKYCKPSYFNKNLPISNFAQSLT